MVIRETNKFNNRNVLEKQNVAVEGWETPYVLFH